MITEYETGLFNIYNALGIILESYFNVIVVMLENEFKDDSLKLKQEWLFIIMTIIANTSK